jgi:N-acetylneuraminate synthase
MKSFKLGRKIINKGGQPYVIAEIGVNFENNFTRAKKIIKLAKKGGADAVKFQSYKAEKIACKNSPYYWDLKEVAVISQYKLFKKFDRFGFKEFLLLKKYCDKLKIDFLSTPFDLDAVDYLSKLVPFYKIASADITNYPLIEKVCKKNKPIILSTGASTQQEIDNTLKFISKINKKIRVILLHCILSYPTKNQDANLNLISAFSERYKKNIIGYSDHTLPDENMIILTCAYQKGAQVIEKHFSDTKGKKGNDHFHSMNEKDLKKLRNNIDLLIKINRGPKERKVFKCEKKSRLNARRSIVAKTDINKGAKLSVDNLIMKRPGIGICPTQISRLIGKTAKKNIVADNLIYTNDIE